MREVIIRRLEAVKGLIVRTAQSDDDAEYITCLVRSSRALLFKHAERLHTRLPIWPEVDPSQEVRRSCVQPIVSEILVLFSRLRIRHRIFIRPRSTGPIKPTEFTSNTSGHVRMLKMNCIGCF